MNLKLIKDTFHNNLIIMKCFHFSIRTLFQFSLFFDLVNFLFMFNMKDDTFDCL